MNHQLKVIDDKNNPVPGFYAGVSKLVTKQKYHVDI
jgi:hypothetical protein